MFPLLYCNTAVNVFKNGKIDVGNVLNLVVYWTSAAACTSLTAVHVVQYKLYD